MLRMFGADLVVALTNTSIGLAGATLIAGDWHAGWLIMPPAAVLMLAYRAYLSEHTKHQSLEFLYGVARSLCRAPDVETRAGRPAGAHARVVPRAHAPRSSCSARRRPAAADVARRRAARTQRCSRSPHELAAALRACVRRRARARGRRAASARRRWPTYLERARARARWWSRRCRARRGWSA